MTEEDKNNQVKSFAIFARVVSYARPFVSLLILSILLNGLFSVFSVITTTFIKPVTEIVFGEGGGMDIPGGSEGGLESIKTGFFDLLKSLIVIEGDVAATLIRLSGFIIVAFLFKNFFKYWGAIVNIKLQEGVVKSIRDKVFDKLTSLSVDFFSKNKEGSIISIITNDVHVLNRSIIMAITDVIRESLQVIVFLFLLLSISPKLTLIAFSASGISLILLRIAVKYLRRYASRMQNAMADYTSAMQESISGIRAVKAYNAEGAVIKKFISQTKRYVVSAVKHRKVIQIIPSANEIFAVVALCVVLYIGGLDVLNGEMLASDLFLFLFSLFSIMAPIASVFNLLSQFQHGFVSAQRVFRIIGQQPTVETGKEEIDKFENSITIENVDFAYEEAPVIRGANFTVPKNKKTALVGASGSGKSTMLDLIIRFYDPKSGVIKIDGRDIRKLNIKSYRSLFGIVSQDTILFNDTIENNIRFGYEKANMDDLENAAKMANAYDFIMNLPKGFGTYVGDRGIMLSGGERQRVAIARALLRNPEILVFDEATSSLDSESEKTVQSAIENSLEDKTAIIVAHRLATIINCDEILVFDRGAIVERGTHKELLSLGGVYKNLYDIQFAGKSG